MIKLSLVGISRREFVKLGLAGMAGACLKYSCKKDATGPKADVPVNCSGSLRGLIHGGNVGSGRIIFDKMTEVEISNGLFSIDNSHNLVAGKYNIRVETDIGYPRECLAELSNSGLYDWRCGYLLDNVIEITAIDAQVYNNWLYGVYHGQSGSERWFRHKPKFFWYDRSLWGFFGAGRVTIVDDNYPVDPITNTSVQSVVLNHVHKYTDGWVHGELHKESDYRAQGREDEMPDPNIWIPGWIIYFVPTIIARNEEFVTFDRDNNGDIYSAQMRFNRDMSLSETIVSINTAKILGISQEWLPASDVFSGSQPTALAQLIAKIKYSRAPYHNMIDGVDGYLSDY
ncbi:MAG: hypothetical protein PVH84_07955 [Candidatus Aminicenantes bacterium]|jgi:hypothetical protein